MQPQSLKIENFNVFFRLIAGTDQPDKNAIKDNKEVGYEVIKTEKMPFYPACNYVPVRISITDTCQGISPENLPRLFNPFERFGAEKSGTEGTGLGLAVVKKLINVMGGKVGVENTPGYGSTFWIEMPHCISRLERADKDGDRRSRIQCQ